MRTMLSFWCVLAALITIAFLNVQCDEPASITRIDSLYVTDTLYIHDTTVVHDTLCPLLSVIPGRWVEILPPIGTILKDTVLIELILWSPDSTYLLVSILERPGDTLMTHSGKWDQIGDTVYLNPDNCAQIDTITRELVPLDTCSRLSLPAEIDATTTPFKWSVKSVDIGPVLSALPIPPEMAPVAQALTFFFERQ